MPTLVARVGDHAVERSDEPTPRHRILRAGTPLPWSSIAGALREHAAAREALTRAIRDCGHDAVFWECAPWPTDGDPAFELVLVPTPAFGGLSASPAAFRAHFDDALVATFDSLGGDARLVAPRPLGEVEVGLHLARFVRGAPPEAVDALWIAVGHAIDAWRAAGRGTLWLSTSGLGVPWLHVRLDSRPKYYTHAPFRAAR